MAHRAPAPALFAANPLPMWILDAEARRVVDVNDAALRRYGLERSEAVGLEAARLVGAGRAEEFRAWAIEADGTPSEAFDQRTADGERFAAELRATHLAWEGRPALLLVVRDMATRRRIEERLQQAQKMEAIGRMAGSIAHDFNNLLTAIGGYAELVMAALPPDDPAAEDAREIRRAVDRGASLTRQLLAFSRRQVVRPQVVDLNAAVEAMRPLLERLLGERTRLVLGLGPSAGSVRIDLGQLEQVLLNLAINGRDAMPAGGRLLVETARVELDPQYAAARRDVTPGPHAVLAVSDEGAGLTDEAREHLFEPFYTTKPRGEGTGLGLATVYGIVRQSGGHIEVFSEPDFGTTFRVYLPAVGDPPEAPESGADPGELPRDGLRGRVLVAEDDPAVRRFIEATLSRAGMDVRAVADGAEGLEALRQEPPPDLVVSDVRMPHVAGPEMVRRARERWPDLPVLYVSGHTGPDTPDDLTGRGARLLGKPFTAEALVSAVLETLDEDRTRP